MNCLKTDFFHANAYPAYLSYNPYSEAREIHVDVGSGLVDLYDTIRHQFMNRRVRGKTSLRLAPDSGTLIVLAPAGGILTHEDNMLLVNGVVVDYHANSSAAATNEAGPVRQSRIFSLGR